MAQHLADFEGLLDHGGFHLYGQVSLAPCTDLCCSLSFPLLFVYEISRVQLIRACCKCRAGAAAWPLRRSSSPSPAAAAAGRCAGRFRRCCRGPRPGAVHWTEAAAVPLFTAHFSERY
jgi:hypothetical protein